MSSEMGTRQRASTTRDDAPLTTARMVAFPQTLVMHSVEYGSEPKRLEDYKDPRQIGRWAERKFREQGMDVPEETRKMIDAAREGEVPEPLDDV